MNEFRTLADLLDLQALDSAIDRLLEQRSSLPELQQFKDAHGEATRIGKELAQVDGELKETSRQLDKSDGELTILEERAKTTEQRLYAGGMNARETEHMQADVRMLKNQVGEMEERVLVLIDQREALEARVNEVRAAHEEANGRKGELEVAIKDAWTKIDSEIARKETRKADLVPSIDADLVELYEQVREVHGGVAVGALDHGTCGACHVEMSPREVALLKKDEFPRCTHCNRLVVV